MVNLAERRLNALEPAECSRQCPSIATALQKEELRSLDVMYVGMWLTCQSKSMEL